MPLVQVSLSTYCVALRNWPLSAVERVVEAVAAGVGQDLAVLAVDLGVDQDVGAGLVIVHRVVRRVLVVPLILPVAASSASALLV